MSEFSSAQLKELVNVKYLLSESEYHQGAMLIMKDNSCRLLLELGAVNMDAVSELTRESIIDIYAKMMDSLKPTFPVQFQIHTKQLDPTPYFQQLQSSWNSQRTPEELKPFIQQYQTKLKDVLTRHPLLHKRNFLVVSYRPRPRENQQAGSMSKILKSTLGVEVVRTETDLDDFQIITAQQQLDLRVSHLENYLQQMQVWCERKTEEEVRVLLQELYHPRHVSLG